MEQLVHCCSYVYHVPVVGQLAEKLAAIMPGGLNKSFFSNSGAEANEGAMRLAKHHTGRHELVALAYGFHGRTIGTLSITGNSARKKNNGPYLSGVAFGPAPYCYRCPLGLQYPSCELACAHALRDVIRQQTSGDVAAFVVEPVLGEGGLITPPPEYLSVAAQIMHEHGALLIVDEVQTGFGRTGKMFGLEHSTDVAADIVTLAKGIASGFPLGAFTAREPVSEATISRPSAAIPSRVRRPWPTSPSSKKNASSRMRPHVANSCWGDCGRCRRNAESSATSADRG
jgi:4-aminobutyrate aminotransferase / (S)-3-amino-2-methylpropionate transaminase / 5-aminovalerate transaminase